MLRADAGMQKRTAHASREMPSLAPARQYCYRLTVLFGMACLFPAVRDGIGLCSSACTGLIRRAGL